MKTETTSNGASQGAPVDTVVAFPQASLPRQIGRYRIERLLGQGGFGSVYLAHDDQLQRLVAVKVAHGHRLSGREGAAEYLTQTRSDGPVAPGSMKGSEGAAAYLAEARAAAGLDHPNIVPVYDFGSTQDCPCFIVSKYIEGFPLTERIKLNRPFPAESAELVATIAEALHYAHRKRLVHRDVKPGNILIDTTGAPFVVDFGLALKEENLGKGIRYAGTPAYMSPEQARGEGHRVDGRSDIFGLGVVFYELLTGVRPFNGDSQAELLEQVRSFEPRPPRQHDDAIPKELERICMKALAKRASERYSTAKELAEDLRHWISTQDLAKPQPGSTEPSMRLSQDQLAQLAQAVKGQSSKGTTLAPATPGPRVHIVPKGLRSFDAHDADFFLEILPGPRDREGLPGSIRFWKTRIEETDPDNTFAVGMIYGPSGCGKSSLVKAGLLPCLSVDVITAYVEATAGETEKRLLNALRRRCPALPSNLNLTETLASLRLGRGVPDGKKVLIVLDQFEQWLHARKDEQDTELVQALRQCDGSLVQCMVMVRDDFWMAATRFMRELEIRLLEAQNSAAVDLFDTDHARKVLSAFGRAFGKLPENPSETGSDGNQFLSQAVAGLVQEGKVISVRLALFAEMMKSRPWTPTALKAVGGTAGVGVTFLEETFSSATAPPEHRYHQKAARAVLKSLLPESGTDIKGHMRSRAELLEASGYASRPKDFDDLIRILDGEVRLLTPTDPEGKEGAEESATPAHSHPVAPASPEFPSPGTPGEGRDKNGWLGNKYYQLTHDYLVPALRDWLTRKQKETRRGRAELLLADRTGVWSARRENRQLPSFRQWFNIRLLTRKRAWTPPQRKMMDRATRYHATRGAVLALFVAVATIAGIIVRNQVVEQQKATQAAGLVKRLIDADTAQVPDALKEVAAYRLWADPLLRQENDKAAAEPRRKLRASLGLLPVDAGQVDYLYGRLLTAEPSEVPVICDVLLPYKGALAGKLWSVVQAPEKGKESTRLRAAAALANYDPQGDRWAACAPLVANDLVRENPVFLGQWSEDFRPVKDRLLKALGDVFRDPQPERLAERNLATNLLADYAAGQPEVLADLLMDADEMQFPTIFAKLKDQVPGAFPELTAEIDRKPAPDARDEDKEKLAKRQASAAVALMKMNQPAKVWPLLMHSPDPRARSYLVHRLAPSGADPAAIARRLDEEPDITIRRALVLSLGEFKDKQWSPWGKTALAEKLLVLYEKELDPGLHAAAEWLLRQWGQDAKLKAIDRRLRMTEAQIHTALISQPTPEQRQRIGELSARIDQIGKSLAESERDLPARQAAWERDVLKHPAPHAPDEGLIAYYPLDEIDGNKTASGLKDQPGGAYEGEGDADWALGVIGGALSLDGNGSMAAGKPLDLECDQPFSYGCWFQYAAKPPMVLISTRDKTKGFRGFDLSLEPPHQPRVQIAGEDPAMPDAERKKYSAHAITVIATTSVDPAQRPGWHHVMATYDGSKSAAGVRIFVDGEVQPTQTLEDDIVGTIKSDAPVYIGSRQGVYRFKGQLDDVRIYNRQLGEADVARLYASGVAAIAHLPAANQTPEQRLLLSDYYRRQDEPLRRMSSELAAARASLRQAAIESAPRRWYVNGQGQTMVVIPGPAEFVMGSPTTEANRQDNEFPHRMQTAGTFAIAARSVTVEEFRKFDPIYELPAGYTRMPGLPVVGTTWYQAAAYCNWLSKQEGIPQDQWCYQSTSAGTAKLKAGYLGLEGYRLPTEAEMEYATRADAVTARYYGETDELLAKYAWYNKNSEERTWPVGSKKPNDFGLFDAQGNVWSWCQEQYREYPKVVGEAAIEYKEDDLTVLPTSGRGLRGGSFGDRASDVRSACRNYYVPSFRNFAYGFRAARTLRLDSLNPLAHFTEAGTAGPVADAPPETIETKLRAMLASRRAATTNPVTQPSTMFWFNYNGDPHLWTQTDATHWEEADPNGHAKKFIIEKPFSDGQKIGTLVRTDDGFEVLIPPIEDGRLLLFRYKPAEPWQNLGPIHLVK